MTACEVITLADELAPNVFSNKIKLFELNRLERRIRVDILGQDPATVTAITEEDLEEPADSGSLASVIGRDDDSGRDDGTIENGSGDAGGSGGSGGSGGGDEIENPGTGQETGDGDPGYEGSGGSGSGTEDPSPAGEGSGDDAGDDPGTEGETGGDAGREDGDDEGDDENEPAGTLALEERYRDVYVFWLISMYYYHMGEYEEYQNKKAMFDDVWVRFERDVCISIDRATGYA